MLRIAPAKSTRHEIITKIANVLKKPGKFQKARKMVKKPETDRDYPAHKQGNTRLNY
jgi:hypothetical protein